MRHSKMEAALPLALEMGFCGLDGVTLCLDDFDLRPISDAEVFHRSVLRADETEDALLEFFTKVYDTTGYRRPDAAWGFPPNAPRRP